MGPLEIILIIVVVVLIFGASKLPQLGKGVGQSIREFKREVKADAPEIERPLSEEDAARSPRDRV